MSTLVRSRLIWNLWVALRSIHQPIVLWSFLKKSNLLNAICMLHWWILQSMVITNTFVTYCRSDCWSSVFGLEIPNILCLPWRCNKDRKRNDANIINQHYPNQSNMKLMDWMSILPTVPLSIGSTSWKWKCFSCVKDYLQHIKLTVSFLGRVECKKC
jgi:hypothetical protein